MISDKAIHSFIVWNGVPWSEFNDDFLVGISLDKSLGLIERKYVVGVCKELKLSVQLWIVINGQNFIQCGFQLYFAEVYAIGTEGYIESMRISLEI